MLVTRVDADGIRRRPDELVVEEPMELRLDDHLVTTTMRTPGHDFELAAGFCLTEGLLADAPVRSVRYCGSGSAVATAFNVVSVDSGGMAPAPTPRLQPTTASCGLCGSASIEQLAARLAPVPPRVDEADPLVIGRLPAAMRAAQPLFQATGAVHAAADFDPADGALGHVREDVGRHNAVDKVVGRLLLDGALPATGRGLLVSSRASFEIVQKAWAAGFGLLVCVGGPTALAVETARTGGIALVGFVRDGAMNRYT